ncbi:MAG: FAD-binding oxidoreductase [Nitrososphaerota archaeon]|nr:FAD-binding oxidoreductase [Nitrososphaerota archaeon]
MTIASSIANESSKFHASLRSVVGHDDVLLEDSSVRLYSKPIYKTNPSKNDYKIYTPQIVVKPESTEEVAGIVSLANSNGFAVYVESGGTDSVGGNAPLEPRSIMLDFMEIDPASMIASVQAGVGLADLDTALKKFRLTHGHRPQTYKIATVGGSVSSYGAGHEAPGFSPIAENVIGLTVVIGTGEILRIRSVSKSSMGEKNLMWLFLGLQGRHGIITEVTLRLQPHFPENRRPMLIGFKSFEYAARVSFAIVRKGFRPSLIHARMMSSLQGKVDDLSKYGKMEGLLELVFDGANKQIVKLQMFEVSKICRKVGGKILPESIALQSRKDWGSRQGAERIKNQLRERLVTQPKTASVSTSFLHVRDFFAFIRDVKTIGAKNRVTVAGFSLKLCPMVVALTLSVQESDYELDQARDRLAICKHQVQSKAIELGGTASSINSSVAFQSLWDAEFGQEGLEVLRNVKLALDPNLTLNRGHGSWK